VHELELGYVGLGAHEELVLSVADALGFYAQEGIRVAVRDATGWDDERLRPAAVVGLGRTVLLRLRTGVPWLAVCVNTDRPLFWLMARSEFAAVDDLRGRRIGVHAPLAAPGCFARIVLRAHGLDPDRDVDAVPMHPGDYAEHLGQLRSGGLDAAVVGSTVSPEQLVAEEGLRLLAFFGDVLQIPTTGVAVDPTTVPLGDGAVAALVRANVRALEAILAEPGVAVEPLRRLIPAIDDAGARDFHARYVAPYFKPDGLPDPAVVARAVPAVAAELRASGALGDAPPPDPDEIYRGDLTRRWSGRS
jgi:ABC-type nitrate/sulfonate/bicarbonate transport system substrate-binding protein